MNTPMWDPDERKQIQQLVEILEAADLAAEGLALTSCGQVLLRPSGKRNGTQDVDQGRTRDRIFDR